MSDPETNGIGYVRTAIRDWFKPPAVPLLNYVYNGSIPRVENPADYVREGEPSTAFGIAVIMARREHRKAFGNPGKKRYLYEAGLYVVFRSIENSTEDAIAAHSLVLDGVVDRLHADRTLGGRVFSAGEGGEEMLDDVDIEMDLPKVSTQLIEIWSLVRFLCSEWANV